MIDTIELRCRVENDGKSGIDLEEIHELLDRLEAAESEALEQARLNGMGGERELALMAKLQAAEKERDALRTELNEIRYGVAVAHDTIKTLRAKIEGMKKRLRLILEEPEATMSNSKALREMVRQARLALEESK